MNCENCGATQYKKPLYRCNPKGVPGLWMCEECRGKVGVSNVMMQPIDPAVKELVTVLSRAKVDALQEEAENVADKPGCAHWGKKAVKQLTDSHEVLRDRLKGETDGPQ